MSPHFSLPRACAAAALALCGATAPARADHKDAPETERAAAAGAAGEASGLSARIGGKLGEAVGEAAPEGWADAAAVLYDANGEAMGAAALRAAPTGVFMRIAAKGLTPGWHGVHFHEVGDCSDGGAGFKKSGPHVDPDGHQHGLMQADGAERGDLPNLHAPKSGLAVAEFFRPGVAIALGSELPALIDADGFAIVVHAASDDQATQPIGGAGARVLCAAFGK
jgi:Cu-Zn family superoxide dismutase